MVNLKHIYEGWTKSLGFAEVTEENKALALERVKKCVECKHAKEQWLKTFIDGFLKRDEIGSGIGCEICGCPVMEKALVINETCRRANGNMPFQIGACCTDQILQPEIDPQQDLSGKNEVIPFENTDTLVVPWTQERRARFGEAGVFYIEILDEDDLYKPTIVIMVPDDILNTTEYTGHLPQLSTGRIIIS